MMLHQGKPLELIVRRIIDKEMRFALEYPSDPFFLQWPCRFADAGELDVA